MNRFNRVASGVVLGMALTVTVGCSDNIALIGRPTLQLNQEELFAEIDRVDTSSRELLVRSDDNRNQVIGYSADARVLYDGREYPIGQLKIGDQVSMQLKKDSRGKSYTDLIRVHERNRDADQNRAEIIRPASGVQTVDGRVEQVDVQRSSFEIRDPSRERVLVSLSNNARRSDVDHLRELRVGDYVRVEGRFLDRERFELENFLRDSY